MMEHYVTNQSFIVELGFLGVHSDEDQRVQPSNPSSLGAGNSSRNVFEKFRYSPLETCQKMYGINR